MGAERESDSREAVQTAAYVVEAEELVSIVQQVVETDGEAAPAVFHRFSALVNKYQEQAQLLDPLLESLVKPLARLLAEHATDFDAAAAALGDTVGVQAAATASPVPGVARLLWQLSAVRGSKAVLRFFPNDVAHFEPIVGLLTALEAVASTTSAAAASFDEGCGLWEAQYVCLIWLALLVLIPFDLALVDTSLSNSSGDRSARAPGLPYPPIVAGLLRLLHRQLASPGSSREAAAVVLGRLVTRPDMGAALTETLDWACEVLEAPTDAPATAFLVPGVALALAIIFKLGQRSSLLGPAARLLPLAATLQASLLAASNALARKLAVKLVQRIGLVFLRPRVAAWRYQKPRFNMALNLARVAAAAEAAEGSAGGIGRAAAASTAAVAAVAGTPQHEEDAAEVDADAAAEAEAGEDVAASTYQLETVVEALLSSLADKDTVVRWSAAKGLGRVTMRLPRDLADDVVGSILEGFFTPGASDTAWHGGCLAVAELASRGLLLPERLPGVAPLVVRALEYDVRRGPCSVGAHVRDAAAYVCWALARAYSPAALGPTVYALAPALITCACYDREVNCRRAAAAAFQECVGRLGSFPHGIAIVTTADYFSVSVRSAAYIHVAPAVAVFEDYFEPLAWHLLKSKLRHWEKSLRELAAQALAALVLRRPSFFLESALPFVLPLCTDSVLEARHGAVAGVAELLPALRSAGAALPLDLQARVAGVLPAIEAKRLTRGKGGEVMRSAICRLIETSAASGLPLDPQQQACAWRQLCENLRHASPDIQAAAAAALAAFAAHCLPGWAPEEQQREALARFLSDLADGANPPARRGAALALGALPAWLLVPAADSVLAALASAATVEAEPETRDAETRVNAVRSLTQVVLKLHAASASVNSINGSSSRDDGYEVVLGVLPQLIAALDDYSTDNRGDVGSWVREAAMEGLVSLLLAVLPPSPDPANAMRLQPLVQVAAAALIKQAVERIARVREVAARQLARLLPAAAAAGAAPAAADALAAAAAAHPEDDPGSLEALPAAAALLRWPEYRQPLLEGLAFSIGGLDRQLSEAAADALADAGQGLSSDKAASLAASLLDTWADHTRAGRLCTPLLLTTEVLLARTPVGDVQLLPEAREVRAASTSGASSAERGGNPFPARLLAVVRDTLRGCTDIPRLHAGVGVLCQLASSGGGAGVGREALRAALLLLANRYPKVRRYTAEAVYTLLLTLEFEEEAWAPEAGEAAGEETSCAAAAGAGELPDADAAMGLLLETAWDGPLEAARTARARVFELLCLPLPVAVARADGGVGGAWAASQPAATAAADENASYAALIERVARGL